MFVMVISDRLVIWYQYAHVVILRSIINMDVEPGDFVEEELMDGVEPLDILTQHVPQILEETGKGLGEGSEEVVEATHSKFEKIWAWYKVNNLEDPQHGENLLASVIDFNSMNI